MIFFEMIYDIMLNIVMRVLKIYIKSKIITTRHKKGFCKRMVILSKQQNKQMNDDKVQNK
jgi:hypothetical protein